MTTTVEPAGTEPVPAEADEATAQLRAATAHVLEWAAQTKVPFDSISIEVSASRGDRPGHRAFLGFTDARYLGLWARTLGLDTLTVERRDGHLDIQMCAQVQPGLWVEIACIVYGRGSAWGGAPIVWRRSQDTGRPTRIGDVSVDDLLAGIAAMGIPQYERPGGAS